MSSAYYISVVIIIIMSAILAYFISKKQNGQSVIDTNINFNSEVDYLKFIENHPNQFILVSQSTRKILFNNKYKLIKRYDNQIVQADFNEFTTKVLISDIANLIKFGVSIQLYVKLSEKYGVYTELLNRNSVHNFNELMYRAPNKDKYKLFVLDKSASNLIVNVDLNIYNKLEDVITEDTVELYVSNGKISNDIDFKNVKDLTLNKVEFDDINIIEGNELKFIKCELSKLDFDFAKIYINGCILDNYNFNDNSQYYLSNIEDIDVSTVSHLKNVHLKDIIENEFNLLSIGSKVTIDDIVYYIVGYYKKYDNTFYYYKARNLETRNIIYFNPLSIGNAGQENVQSNLDVLLYYSKFLPERNRADTYNKRIIDNAFTYDISTFNDDIKPELEALNLIESKSKQTEINNNINASKLLEIENLFLKDILKKEFSIDQIVEFYEDIFDVNLIESRISFLTLDFIDNIIYTQNNIVIYDKENDLETKIEFLINLYEKNN